MPEILLVVSDGGEAALVPARPERSSELGLLAALTGKTWGHPVVAGDRLRQGGGPP